MSCGAVGPASGSFPVPLTQAGRRLPGVPTNPDPSSDVSRPRRGDTVELLIDSVDERGRGLSYIGETRILTRFAGPGMRVRARLGRGKGKMTLSGAILEILDAGPFASDPRCPHVGTCGGCALPRTTYEEQLVQKRGIVERAVRAAFEGTEDVAVVLDPDVAVALVEDVIPAEVHEGYRNKMDFTFGSRRFVNSDEPEAADASFALGLHAPAFFSKVLDIDHCAIAFESASSLVRDARRLAREMDLEPWDLRSHTGLLRHLVVRHGARTGDTMVNLVTSERAAERIDPYAAALLELHPEVTTLVQNVTTRLATVAYGESEFVLHGPGTIVDVIAGKRFTISADSFFQTNTAQAERLFAMTAEAAEIKATDVVYDIYCGAGTIGLAIADHAAQVVGFESVPSAIRDARANAEANGVEHATFVEGDVLEEIGAYAGTARPDVLIVDPPRAGLHPKVAPKLLALDAPRIVYVSCNPKTGARDVRDLIAGGYELRSIRPIDLFPHTPHVEVVFTLSRLASSS